MSRLPAAATEFIGRRGELAYGVRLLKGARLLTLTGPAGIGKTRLAIELARRSADDVWFVELAGLRDERAPARALAVATGLAERRERDQLAEGLREWAGLVVLDNCEHVVGPCAELTAALLAGCPDLRIMTTSREALGVAGEVVWPVPGLELPDPASRPGTRRLRACDAVSFFAGAAGRRLPGFEIRDGQLATAARICRRLDAIPLALELAAARIAHMTLEEIERRLAGSSHLLTSPNAASAGRHRSLWAAIDESYDLLTDADRTLFQRLSVFRGGFGLDAAAAVAGVPDALAGLARLADKSLVMSLATSGTPRYRLLETLREHALGRLRDGGEEDEVRARHASWFLAMGEGANPVLYGHHPAPALAGFDVEHDNLRAALDWALEHDPPMATRLGTALGQFWVLRGHLAEGRERLDRCLAVANGPDGPPPGLLLAAGNLALRQDDFVASRRYLRQAASAATRAGKLAAEARAHDLLGRAALEAGDLDEAEARLATALRLYRQVRSAGGEARVHWHLNLVATCRGDYDAARGNALRMQTLCRSIEDPWGTGLAHLTMGNLGLIDGDLDAAARELRSALELLGPLGERWSLASALRVAAGLAVERGAGEPSLVLMGAADGLDDAIGGRLPRVLEQSMLRWREAADQATAPDRARAALVRGRRMTLAEAVGFALDVTGGSRRHPAAGLTSREVAVARLMAEGITDREIAARLSISVRTVEKHAENVRSKLGVGSRSEVASTFLSAADLVQLSPASGSRPSSTRTRP